MSWHFFPRVGLGLFAVPLFAVGCQKIVILPPEPVACTQEAKICPDGTAVGRVGPSCEFAPCPSPTPTPTPIPSPIGTGSECSGVGDPSCPVGTQCIQDCGPPVVRVDEPPPLYHCVDNAIAGKPRMCPICLASNTQIATPSGAVNVKDIKTGMLVWSLNAQGEKVASTVVRTSRSLVPTTHRVISFVLSDARRVWVSPGHPTKDGAPVSSLQAGDFYDGATVVSTGPVPYWDAYTYDVLPDSETGSYWANGILLGSTLSSR